MNFSTRRIQSATDQHPLDRLAGTRQFTRRFSFSYVTNLQYYGIKSHARQRYSPARPGKEERRRRAAYYEKRDAHFRTEPAAPAYLGACAEEVCTRSRY